MRMRAVVGLLAIELFGEPLPIADFPRLPRFKGIGTSDAEGYAGRLSSSLDYSNTFFHKEPRLDITKVPSDLAGSLDFLISSDVFEHVVPPISAAFTGARRLLKPGGLFVLTVPFRAVGSETVEHFPELHDWSLTKRSDDTWRLDNRRKDGVVETFTDLGFHGGEGATLEMRIFTQDSLLMELDRAGFQDVRIAGEAIPEIGVIWPEPPDRRANKSLPVIARA